ncbi:MAG: flagellar hook protein FlgE [Chromatiales bacterium]|nr:flagellar hook protein FlgE [Chromatiales bacterium]
MPFQIALSGLDAASTELEVTGHNIANATTNGFKQARTEFSDVYAASIQDSSSTASGRGVKVSRIAQQFSQGTVEFTSNAFDLAINGEGLFAVKDNSGALTYTRAGAYSLDREGNVVNAEGKYLQGFPATENGGVVSFNTGSLTNISVPATSGEPFASTNVDVGLNLDSGIAGIDTAAPGYAFDRTDPTTFTNSTATTIYDSLGTPYTMTMYFVKDANAVGSWDVHAYVTDPATGISAEFLNADTLQFNSAGGITSPANGQITLAGFDTAFAGGAASSGGEFGVKDQMAGTFNNSIVLDFSTTSQYGSSFSVNDLTQDGYTAGQLSGVDIDEKGVVFARFTNGQSQALAQVALAKFKNQQGLKQSGNTSWEDTFKAGDVQYAQAGTSGLGLIQSGALENSNVDIADQLVAMITAQRNYQANAQVISTADAITQTVINIR